MRIGDSLTILFLCAIYFRLTCDRKPTTKLPGKRFCGSTGLRSRIVGQNPAAGQYVAQAYLWRSHFEESAPVLQALAEEYPADTEVGQTASSIFRSLAYFDPGSTGAA